MEIKRSGSSPSQNGDKEYFTGSVRIELINEPPAPSRLTVALVPFDPGSRTVWHSHPFGQTLIITAGAGWVQSENYPKQPIFVGDMIYVKLGERHWHGASKDSSLSHLAIQEKLFEATVEGMEPVSEDQYQ